MIGLERSTFEIPQKKYKILKAIFWNDNHLNILEVKVFGYFQRAKPILTLIFNVTIYKDSLFMVAMKLTLKRAWPLWLFLNLW